MKNAPRFLNSEKKNLETYWDIKILNKIVRVYEIYLQVSKNIYLDINHGKLSKEKCFLKTL
jgi:hypothetical protein